LSHADIEEITDDQDHASLVAVCPWHRYDFDLETGHSQTGMRACTFKCELRPAKSNADEATELWIEAPEPVEGGWQLVEKRPVSEGLRQRYILQMQGLTLSADFAIGAKEAAQSSETENTSTLSDGPASAVPAIEREPVVPLVDPPRTLIEWAVLVLNTSDPVLKVERTRHAVHQFRTGKIKSVGQKSGTRANYLVNDTRADNFHPASQCSATTRHPSPPRKRTHG